jgi:uncharacterized protein (TIGR02444 family)
MKTRSDFCRSVWPDMVALYGHPGIGDLCLGLQADFDADVPLLLTLVLADEAGEGLDDGAFEHLRAAASTWRALAVVPLRQLRIRLKDGIASPDEEAFRRAVKAAELEAERLEILRILDVFEPNPGPSGDLSARYLAALGVPAERADAALASFRGALAAPPSRNVPPA